MRGALLLALLAASAAAPAAAELVLEGVGWQAGKPGAPADKAWSDAASVSYAPPKPPARLRGKLKLKNRGPKPAEGILVRWTLAARMKPEGDSGDGAWGIPFVVETKRVPAMKPNELLEAPLQLGAGLGDYLRRLHRAGWRPDRVRLQAMLEPRAGDAAVQTAEAVLELAP